MSEVKRYSDLEVWKKSMDLTVEAYQLLKTIPSNEQYCLADQIRRSVVSIPSNIAEGFERLGTKEYVHFLSIANGSRAEFMTQLEIGRRLGYFSDISQCMQLCEEIGKMLVVMIKKLNTKN